MHEPRYGPRVVEEKRRHRLDEIHEEEAEEELDDFLHRLGKTSKE